MISWPALPLVSVVIPNYNGAAYLETCLLSLLRQSHEKIEIFVVDNASSDDSVGIIRRTAPRAEVLRQQRNLGFAGGVNAGIRVSRGEWIAVLNNDAEAAPDWLAECMAFAGRHPEAGFLACRILEFRERGRVYSAGDCFLRTGIGYRRGQEMADRAEYRQEGRIFSACGCAALYRREVLEKAGGFDERFFAYLEDVDLALRLQAAGYRGYYAAKAVVYHMGGMTSGGEFSSLAVRLRTRNAILLLVKSLPASVLMRCAPMIFLAQLAWMARTHRHGKLRSYLCGLAGVIPFLPAMLAERSKLRRLWRNRKGDLWNAIRESEAMARIDFTSSSDRRVSTFLSWYFRIF